MRPQRVRRALREGDVFAVPLPGGRFGAVRVLRTSSGERGISALVAITPWLRPAAPKPEDPELRRVLRRHRGRFGGSPAVCWYEGEPPAAFVFVGNVAVSAGEESLDAEGAFCGAWHSRMAQDVLLERGETLSPREGDSPSAEDESTREVSGDLMPDSRFWDLVSTLDLAAEDEKQAVEPLVFELTRLRPDEIAGFARTLSRKLFCLDRQDIATALSHHAYGSAEGFSPDHFLDVRCAIVARGEQFYQMIVSQPEWVDADEVLEYLVTAPDEAYFRRTSRAPRFTGLSKIETFSNDSGWKSVSE